MERFPLLRWYYERSVVAVFLFLYDSYKRNKKCLEYKNKWICHRQLVLDQWTLASIFKSRRERYYYPPLLLDSAPNQDKKNLFITEFWAKYCDRFTLTFTIIYINRNSYGIVLVFIKLNDSRCHKIVTIKYYFHKSVCFLKHDILKILRDFVWSNIAVGPNLRVAWSHVRIRIAGNF
jgi:hypothetical protein